MRRLRLPDEDVSTFRKRRRRENGYRSNKTGEWCIAGVRRRTDCIDRCVIRSGDDCVGWEGTFNKGGYAIARIDGKTVAVFRHLYELLVAPIPDGELLHHRCRNRWCVNPLHMQPMSNSEHYKLHAADRVRKPKAACAQGHPFTEATTYVCPRGFRQCRICRKARRGKKPR